MFLPGTPGEVNGITFYLFEKNSKVNFERKLILMHEKCIVRMSNIDLLCEID